ncbi:3-dehydroquinate synthase [Candidatus Methylomirabilis lanthanidiphila]|uniref:3-dehydroquinate synthase n=1 Tax=Candidatus Methylomirabilis lanthanidiphila TaxID=2211376 RepID=A0A564ZGB8_9BACT|nr:3-dehydroquinate synthase [Candidatus Methylomirabilis lanthanidiphila]VUZ84391.1 3-dehydroquinate synthase [Candidatus Methylomirabilis lanthanidiphila]
METGVRVPVALGSRSYQIVVGSGVLKQVGALCGELLPSRRVMIVTNPVINRLYGTTVSTSLRKAGFQTATIEIPAGERAKSLRQAARLYRAFLHNRMDRRSIVVALGGGVIGDLAGYAAATFLRGVPFVQIPTTLLAQVDSSVGGKVAVDLPEGKNLIGAFYQPSLVVADVETLKSLPPRQMRAGLGEVVKYGMIADRELFGYVETYLDAILRAEEEPLTHLVTRSCAIKAQIVEQDEREEGIRAVLNFGHTVGHALETMAGYHRLLHGEAIAIGMVVATMLSVNRGLCEREDLDRLRTLLTRIGLPTKATGDMKSLVYTIGYDKKVRNRVIYCVLTKGIGHVALAALSDLAELRAAIRAAWSV